MIAIQPRDRKLIDLTYEHQFLRVEDAKDFIYAAKESRSQRRRIAELAAAGFIRFEALPFASSKRIIRLTSSGIKLAEIDRAERIPQLRKISIQTLLHDSIVTSVRLRLAGLWDATWIPERLIKSESFPQIPDGVVVFESGTTIAIEVENSPKGPKRFRELQERWRRSKVFLCLYVASCDVMYRLVQNYLKQGPHDLPFALVNWRELESGTPRAWTVQGEIDLFTRRVL